MLKIKIKKLLWKLMWMISPSFRVLNANKHRLNVLSTRIENREAKLNVKIKNLDTKIKNLDTKIKNLDTNITSLDYKIDSQFKSKLENIQQLLDEGFAGIETYEKQNELETHIAKIRLDSIAKALHGKERGLEHNNSEKRAGFISIICLIYKSTSFARAVHDSLYKYTPELSSGEAELLFVANDATDDVINFLKNEKYNYVVNNNETLSNDELFRMGYGKPEYINRVYKGYNYGIKKCVGDIVVLINSDIMFSPNWLSNLLRKLEKNTIVCSQLVERNHPTFGVFPTAIRGEFGNHPDNYLEEEFLSFAEGVRKNKMIPGGAYMPCMSYKDNFVQAGYYPEGNIAGETFDQIIQYGDENLYERLLKDGVMHTTACDSIVYHFKEGEKEDGRQIYLQPVIRSGYGEETFWVWFEKNFPNTSYELPKACKKEDIILQYSTKPPLKNTNAKTIALCWELLPEMKVVLKSDIWDNTINTTYENAKRADRIVVASRFSVPYYEEYGEVDILPIGVDTDLFRPYSHDEKQQLRNKYKVPLGVEVGFWCGTTHEMKGFQNVQRYADENSSIYWIIVWYGERGNFTGNGQEHYLVNQSVMAELMNCANFQLSASILRPYYIIEYEGMACNLPQRKIIDIEKDFEAGGNPRDVIFEKKWDRWSAKALWKEYLEQA